MRSSFILSALLFFSASAASTAWAKSSSVSIAYRNFGPFKTYVVTANLNDSDVKVTPILSRHGIGSAERYSSMI
ncbi:MAG: hypothetical protein KY468_18465, partial [Armatimonadetes bacterium]|nr:hypothetical protein [Armatimonadota bacterium]